MIKKVLNLAHVVSLRKVGGVERCFAEFINVQIPQHRLIHHTILPRPSLARELAHEIKSGSKTVRCVKSFGPFKLPKYPTVFRTLNIRRIFKSIGPDAIILWNAPTMVPVQDLPGDIPCIYYEHGASWFKRDSHQIRNTLDHVSGIICNSRAAKRMIELRWGQGYGKKTIICLNALRPGCVPNSGTLPPNRSMNHTLHLGIAARLVPIKGIPLAIHTISLLKKTGIHAKLSIAGSGSRLSSLNELVIKMGLTENVRFMGFVNDMKQFFSSIDFLICPSIREPFGLICAEAMAYGIPVIAAKVDGLPEVVQDNITGVCISPTLPVSEYPRFGGDLEGLPEFVYDPDSDSLAPPRLLDPGKIAEAIISIWHDKNRYVSMSKAARAICIKNFDFTRYAQEVVSSIQSVIGSSSIKT